MWTGDLYYKETRLSSDSKALPYIDITSCSFLETFNLGGIYISGIMQLTKGSDEKDEIIAKLGLEDKVDSYDLSGFGLNSVDFEATPFLLYANINSKLENDPCLMEFKRCLYLISVNEKKYAFKTKLISKPNSIGLTTERYAVIVGVLKENSKKNLCVLVLKEGCTFGSGINTNSSDKRQFLKYSQVSCKASDIERDLSVNLNVISRIGQKSNYRSEHEAGNLANGYSVALEYRSGEISNEYENENDNANANANANASVYTNIDENGIGASLEKIASTLENNNMCECNDKYKCDKCNGSFQKEVTLNTASQPVKNGELVTINSYIRTKEKESEGGVEGKEERRNVFECNKSKLKLLVMEKLRRNNIKRSDPDFEDLWHQIYKSLRFTLRKDIVQREIPVSELRSVVEKHINFYLNV